MPIRQAAPDTRIVEGEIPMETNVRRPHFTVCIQRSFEDLTTVNNKRTILSLSTSQKSGFGFTIFIFWAKPCTESWIALVKQMSGARFAPFQKQAYTCGLHNSAILGHTLGCNLTSHNYSILKPTKNHYTKTVEVTRSNTPLISLACYQNFHSALQLHMTFLHLISDIWTPILSNFSRSKAQLRH